MHLVVLPTLPSYTTHQHYLGSNLHLVVTTYTSFVLCAGRCRHS
jgi:hypothetical protein